MSRYEDGKLMSFIENGVYIGIAVAGAGLYLYIGTIIF
jgi:hypothetical protein